MDIAHTLIKLDPKNIDALEILGTAYYRMAEDAYQNEMKDYENNKTNRQYRHLLKALDEINENFRIARDYLERLYEINPTPRHATMLGNIYTRFDNKQRASYYYGRSKEQRLNN